MKRWLHGWEVFFHCYNLARFKKHGAKGLSVRDAALMARMARWVAVQQHRPDLFPMKLLRKGERPAINVDDLDL